MMRLFIKASAPSALRVQIFIDECDRSIETVEVADTNSPDFRRMNPFGTVPVLETETGDYLSESLSICRYLDSIWNANLFGRSTEERARVDMWERRAELLLVAPAIEFVHQSHPVFAGRAKQHAGWAEAIAERARNVVPLFEERLNGSPFLGSDTFSTADITGFLGISAFAAFGIVDLAEMPALRRWSAAIGSRPSTERLRSLAI